jgi:hypothetical protein
LLQLFIRYSAAKASPEAEAKGKEGFTENEAKINSLFLELQQQQLTCGRT